jgi:hypothetical protein
MLPRSGNVLRLTQAASPQFAQPILFRVVRVLDWDTYDGWTWLDGYQLDRDGRDAVARRSLFVQVSGLQQAEPDLGGGGSGKSGGVRKMSSDRISPPRKEP